MNQPILLANGQSQARPAPQPVQFDGYVFDALIVMMMPGFLQTLYIASRARHGDPQAAELLTAFRINIVGELNGLPAPYWPPAAAGLIVAPSLPEGGSEE